jgi:uncharacterized protein YfdQ (DUF2303 family)
VTEKNRTEADAVGELATRAFEPRLMEIEDPIIGRVEVFVGPNNVEPRSIKKLLDEYRTEPERKRGTAALQTLQSFIAHVNRHKDPDSVIFATESNTRLACVFDYNHAGADGDPRFGVHRAHYDCPLSDEWKAWDAIDGKQLGPNEFAEFIESRIADIVDPSSAGDGAKKFADTLGVEFAGPAKVMEMSRGIALRVNAKVARQVNLQSGVTQFVFQEQHNDENGEPLKVPGAFLIAIPVFKGGALYQLPVRLRYRVGSGGTLSWTLARYRDDRALQHAFAEVCETAQKETALPLFFGTPE